MNTKFRKLFTKSVSLIIVMIMIVGSFPLSIFAGEPEDNDAQNAKAYSDANAAADDQSDYQLIPNILDLLNISNDDKEPDAADVPVNGAVDDDPAEEPSDEPVAPKGPSAGSAKAAPPATVDRLSISGDGTDYLSGNSYVMADALGKGFIVNYRYSDMENVVLVVECLDIGVDFAAIPEQNDFVEEAVLIGQGKMALKLKKASESTNCSIGFQMKNVALTNAQVLEIMDGDVLPTSRIAAAEYTLPSDANIKDVLTKGEKHDEKVFWEGSPYFNPDATVSVTTSEEGYTHSFKLTVPPLSTERGSYTNIYLEHVCWQQDSLFGISVKYDGYKNGAPRFALPSAYDREGSLMEILSIRIYEPTDKVRLKEIDVPGTRRNNSSSDLLTSDFNGNWGKWKVGERTFDPDKNAYYYVLTPPSRVFNSNSVGMSQYLAGMTLRWTMADVADALEFDTSYLAEDTEIIFRLPGDGDNSRTAKVRGPEILTGTVDYLDVSTDLGINRYVVERERIQVMAGNEYKDEFFSGTSNGIVVTASKCKYPKYTGTITQEYDFPYQIEPQKITIRLKRKFPMMSDDAPVIESISYNTWDDNNWKTADQDTIDKINAGLAQTDGALGGSFVFPTESQIKNVKVRWTSLTCWSEYADYEPEEVNTYFDFKVNHCTSDTCEDHLADGVYVHSTYREYYDSSYRNGVYKPNTVSATILLPGQTQERKYNNLETDHWYRIICPGCRKQTCPVLIAKFKDGKTNFFNSPTLGNVGDIGFDIGAYGERYDKIHNPKISLYFKNAGGSDLRYGRIIYNIRDRQMLAFFTGEFTAMPKLSGWKVTYSAMNSEQEVYTNTVTIPEITDENGVAKKWLPIPEGYAFTSTSFSYDGEFDLSHKDENDTNTQIWLIKDIKVNNNSKVPFIENELYVEDYQYGCILLCGSASFDITELADDKGVHCQCGKHISGQQLAYDYYAKAHEVTSNRRTTFSLKGSIPSNISVYQGEGIGDTSSEDINVTWDAKGTAGFSTNYNSFNAPGTSTYMYPYEDISEAVYIELTDDEIIPDLANSYLWGYLITGQNVISDIIVINDEEGNQHRFLKLKFVEGFIREKTYFNNAWKDSGVLTLDSSSRYYGSCDIISYYGHYYRSGNVTGPFRLAFKTIPGTSIGEHHPIGMIYYDFSDLLRNYNASSSVPKEQWGGYDDNHTVYQFAGENIVKDTMGLTGDDTSSLFYQDGSSWTVSVLLQQQSGVSYAPGKNSTFYDLENRNIRFYTGEEDDLNAIISISGPSTGTAEPVYDMTSVIVLPRKGKQIKYTHTDTESGSQTDYERESDKSTMDICLRGAPEIVGNGTGVTPELVYTTAADPLSSQVTWLSADSVSNWEDVTGIKIVLSVIEPYKSVNFRLDLKTDAKTGLDTFVAYSGGDFTYRLTQNGSFIDTQHINLVTWNYSNYEIDGFVFWDTFDESGLFDPDNESGINGVTLTLYDASGKVISQADHNEYSYGQDGSVRTANGGKFRLLTNSGEKGQYVKIGLPKTDDGSTPALTSTSKQSYIVTNSDSDFDRTTYILKLDRLSGDSDLAGSISAGYIKLPKLKVKDIEMYVGDTLSEDALIDEFVSNTNYEKNNILTDGTYKIEFLDIDETIATFGDHGALTYKDDSSLTSTYAFTGIKAGKFTANAVLTNRVGDSVSAAFTVTVRQLEDIIVTNSWDDDNNRDGIRPDGVTVQLMKNGVAEGDPVVLSEANDNTFTWPKMSRYDDEWNEIEYTLNVTPVADVPSHTGYTQTVEKSDYIADLTDTLGGYKFTINNVHVPEKVDLTVSKVWEDNNNSDKLRPGNITVELSDGTRVELNDGNKWTYTAADRFKYENGKEIKYTWTEVNVPDGYTLTVNESGYETTLINTYLPVVDVIVTNIWDDDNNRDGIRPDGVTVQLMKDGVAEGDPVVLSEENSNTFTWSKLPHFNEKGDEFEYTLSVTPIADVPGHTGYTQTVDKTDYVLELAAAPRGYRFTVKNVHIPERVDPTVSKVWEDDDNRDGIRPESITVELSDGTRAELNDGNKWTYTASNRYKYENGKEIKYTWTEVNVPDGYELTSNESGYETTLVNKHDPETVERTVVAVWIDDDNIDGIRPENLKVGFSDCSTVTIDEKISWTTTLDGLFKYQDGKLMDYSWIAPEVPEGYTFSQTVEGTVTTLIYVHTRDTKDPTVTPTPPVKKVTATGEKAAIGSAVAAVLIPAALGMAAIAVRGLRKKENE